MEREELKLLGSKIVEGSFEELTEVLAVRSECLTQKQALYLIVCCCNTCNSFINNCDKLNEGQLISSVIGLSNTIKKITSEEYDNYLQSIFFISKLLIKKSYHFLLEIKNEMLPQFIPQVLTPKQEKCYRSICDLIQNVIIQLAKDKIHPDEKTIISLGNFMSKIIIETLNGTIFMEYVFKYGYCLSYLNIDLDVQYGFFLNNVQAIKDFKASVSTDEISHFLKFGFQLFCSYANRSMVPNSLICIDEMMHFIPKGEEWIGSEELLKFCKYVIDPDSDKKHISASKDVLMEFLRSYRKPDKVQMICKLVTQVMLNFANSYNNNGKKIFTDPEKHMIVYEILSVLMVIFLKILEPCRVDCKCLSKNCSEVSDLALCILTFFSLNLSTNNLSKEYISEVKSLLKKNFQLWVAQKSNGCQGYKKCWSDATPFVYNLGVLLFRTGEYEETISFANMILKFNCSLGEQQEGGILPNIFNILNSIYLKQKSYKEALVWTAVEIFHTNDKNSRRKVFSKWVKIKSMCREDNLCDLQEFTIISITEVFPKEYACYIKKLESKEFQIELLICELEVYQAIWKSKVSMMSSFRHLCRISDKGTIMKIFVRIFTDEGIRAHEVVIELLKKAFSGLEDKCLKNDDNTLMLYFSFYLYFLYQHQTLEMISNNLEEMKKIEKLTKNSENNTDMLPTDAFDQCDVVSVYANLKLEGGKLKNLEKALEALEKTFSPKMSPVLFKDVEPKKIYDLIMNIAIEFELHSDEYRSLRSLALAYNLAEFLSDKCLLLECGGYFLRFLHNSGFTEKLEGYSDILIENQKNNEYLMKYYMNLAHFNLFKKNISQSLTYHKNAKKMLGKLNEEGVKNLWCWEVNMELLLFKLLHTAKSMRIKMEMKFTYGPLMKAYDMIVHKYRTEPIWTTHSMVILLDVFESLVKMYHDLRMPREVRCFGKQYLMLAQQNLLPVHSAKILSYLAYADLWSERLDDCRVKLDGISDILLLDKSERCQIFTEQKSSELTSSVDDVTIGIKEMMLDTPSVPAFNIQSFTASPTLQSQAYKCPFFMSHSMCECFHCTSSECQKIVLSRYHLEALCHIHKGQITLADSYFKGTFKLYLKISEKRKHRIKVFHNYLSTFFNYSHISPDDLHEEITSFHEDKMYASISYIKFLAHSGARDAARTFCEKALQNFRDSKIYYPHLYGEMLLQKLVLMCRLEENKSKDAGEIEISVNCEDNMKVKTPETCMKNIPNHKIKSPRKNKFLAPKVIKFNLTDLDPDKTPLKTIKNSRDVDGTPIVLTIPPTLRHISTPNLKTPKRQEILNGENKEMDNSENNSNEGEQISKTPLKTNSFKTPKPANIPPKPKNLDTLKIRTLSRKDIFKDEEKTLTSLENYPDKIKKKESNTNETERSTNLEEKTRLLTSKLRKKNISENNSSKSGGTGNENGIPVVRRSKRNRT